MKEFLKGNRISLIYQASLLILIFIIFELYHLPWPVFYLLAAVFLLVSFFYLLKQGQAYQKLDQVERIQTKLEDDYQAYRTQTLEDRRHLEDYFLMWVHQIKTPITASHLLLEEDPNLSQREGLKVELLAIENYTNMAINYLKISKPEVDMVLEVVNLDDIIRPLLRKYRTQFIAKRINLDYSGMKIPLVTEANLSQVMIEQILSNALKYSKGGTIRIYFDPRTYQLTIQDQGPGIRSEDLPRIFERGYSGFNGKLNEKSSGLGLYLVDLIGRRLNQTVSVRSDLGEGSAFTIQFNRPDTDLGLD